MDLLKYADETNLDAWSASVLAVRRLFSPCISFSSSFFVTNVMSRSYRVDKSIINLLSY